MFHFLVCDDEQEQCDAIEKMILDNMEEYRQSCKITKFYEAAYVMESIEDNEIHAAFLDIDMAGTSGIELARQITEADASVYILLILRTLKTGGLPEIKLLLASENEFSNFRAVC